MLRSDIIGRIYGCNIDRIKLGEKSDFDLQQCFFYILSVALFLSLWHGLNIEHKGIYLLCYYL